VVAAEPQNKKMLDEVCLVTGMQEVYAYVGLRSTIAAAIRKYYYGDHAAFASLEATPSKADVSTMANAYENTSGSFPRPSLQFQPSGSFTRVGGASLQLRLDPEAQLRLQQRQGTPARNNTRAAILASRGTVPDNDYIETLNILVTMLEQERKHLRGHSAQLARQAAVVARRLGMTPRDVSAVHIASYLHDLGKPADRHFCLANNAMNAEWMADAKRYCRAPTKLFEMVNLPAQANTMLAQLYEAYDGSGGPQGVKGDDITLGARIIATVDSYLELTKNPANAFGKAMTREQALEHLRENSGKLYDPLVADIVMQVQSGELLRHRITSDGRQILIVDPDEGTRTDLLECSQKQGLVTHSLSQLEGAYDALVNQECDVLVVGVKFGLEEVLGLLTAVRNSAEHAGLPVVMLGEADAGTRERLMMGGATAVLSPSAPVEAAKTIRTLFDERIQNNGPARTVRGSLDELPLADLLKLLGAGRKSGRLYLKYSSHEGFLHLEQGQIVYATIAGQNADQAAQTLLAFRQADFRYDPDSLLLDVPQMNKTPEALLQQFASRKTSIATATV
jgi:HD-GYP domain-containing protein (c-di-GMP phosphodiesterase class II)/DNA-binding response OmpR family regulator